MSRILYLLISLVIILPLDKLGVVESPLITAPLALLLGLVLASTVGTPWPKANKKASKWLLQAAVVGLGFGMNLNASLQSGAEGMTFTIVSVVGVMALGVLLGMLLRVDRSVAYLISSGTAICGGSAIAAVGPVIHADERKMAVSLGVVFILNALALFIFPPIGHALGLTQQQFGTWAAIAIHDTSSVVGAGEVYGQTALEVATLIKLTRALWIIPLALVTMFIFGRKGGKVSIPWFIFMFIGAMLVNTYLPLPQELTSWLVWMARRAMVLTLFFIGASLPLKAVKEVGIKPLVLAVILWVVIGLSSLWVVTATIN